MHKNGIGAFFMFTCRAYKFGPPGQGMERSYRPLTAASDNTCISSLLQMWLCKA